MNPLRIHFDRPDVHSPDDSTASSEPSIETDTPISRAQSGEAFLISPVDIARALRDIRNSVAITLVTVAVMALLPKDREMQHWVLIWAFSLLSFSTFWMLFLITYCLHQLYRDAVVERDGENEGTNP